MRLLKIIAAFAAPGYDLTFREDTEAGTFEAFIKKHDIKMAEDRICCLVIKRLRHHPETADNLVSVQLEKAAELLQIDLNIWGGFAS